MSDDLESRRLQWLEEQFSDKPTASDIVKESAKNPPLGSLKVDSSKAIQTGAKFDPEDVAKLNKIMELHMDPRMETKAHFIRHWVCFGILETLRLHGESWYTDSYAADLSARQSQELIKTYETHAQTAASLISTFQSLVYREPKAADRIREAALKMYRSTEFESIHNQLQGAFGFDNNTPLPDDDPSSLGQ